MSFKIVQTVEKGKKVLSIIPVAWESEGIMYWNNSTALRENPVSIPDKASWPAMPCTVKRRNILSLREALMEERRMIRFSDTEEDGEERPARKKKTPLSQINYNHLMCNVTKASSNNSTSTEDVEQFLRIEKVQTFENNSKRPRKSVPIVDGDNDNYNSLFSSPTKCINVPASVEVSDQNTKFDLSESRFELIERRLTNLEKIALDTQKDVRCGNDLLAKMLVLQEKFMPVSVCDEAVDEVIDTARFEVVNKLLKIDSTSKLEDLETKLNNAEFLKVFVDCLAQLCGKSGKKDAKKCKYIIFDYIFCRKLITNCSWTGITHDKSNPKIKFSSYENIIDAIYRILKLADCTFNRCDIQHIISAILHNSTSRLKQEIVKKISDTESEPQNDDK